MSVIWVGLDVGENSTALCATVGNDEAVREELVPTSADCLLTAIAPLGPADLVNVVMEAGMGNQLARALSSSGYNVTMVDTVRARKFLAIRRNKTDSNDARGLAALGRLQSIASPNVHIKSTACQQLRSQLVARNRMVKHRTATDLSLRTLLREHGGDHRVAPPRKFWRENLAAETARLSSMGVELDAQVARIIIIRDAVQDYISWADKILARVAKSDPVADRLMQIPGVGVICALSFITAIESPTRFARATDAGPYFGLVPRVKQSGTSLQHFGITKAGNKMTRGHLVMAANVMLCRANARCALGEWGKDLKSRIGHPKAKVAVARKLAVLMATLWKSNQAFVPYPASPLPPGEASSDPDHMSGDCTSNHELGPNSLF